MRCYSKSHRLIDSCPEQTCKKCVIVDNNLSLITILRLIQENRGRQMTKSVLIILSMLCFSIAVSARETVSQAPDFTLKSHRGENIRLGELSGDIVLLNFWASWCGPCRKEMPELDKLHKKYKNLGFTVLGINVEKESSAAKRMLAKSPVSFPILYDSENVASKLYDIKAMPTTIIIDKDGNARFFHLAYESGYEKKYEEQIKILIKEP